MEKINYKAEGHSIPFEAVAEAVNYMKYGSVLRVMFLMLHYKGARISELENKQVNLLSPN